MISELTRGGQTFNHQVKMSSQVVSSVLMLIIITFVVSSIFTAFKLTSAKERYEGIKWVEANAGVYIFAHIVKESMIDFHDEKVKAEELKKHIEYNRVPEKLYDVFLKSLKYGGGVAGGVAFVVLFYYSRKGAKLKRKKYLRGAQIESSNIKKIAKYYKKSKFTIANVPIVKDSELQHTLILGSPGCGKTVIIKERLQQIRNLGQRAIVYDRSGIFAENFYRPGKDILLNPLDARSAQWNIWSECTSIADFDTIAGAIIPDKGDAGSNQFFIDSARTIFSALAYKLFKDGNTQTKYLREHLFNIDSDGLQALLKGSVAQILTSDKIEKTALNIKAVLANYLKFLDYIEDESNPFSIRQWVGQENDDSWIFITSTARQHAVLKPLISAWIDTAALSICSLSPMFDRRIHLIIDEGPSLQNMPSLKTFAAEGRKYGGCLVFSAQSPSQCFEMYGDRGGKALIDCFSTNVYFRVNGADNSKYLSNSLGEEESEIVNENISFGASDVRGGVSLQKQDRIRSIVLSSQISSLDDLEAYIRMKGPIPIIKIKCKYKEYEKVAEPFVPVEDKANNTLSEVNDGYKELEWNT